MINIPPPLFSIITINFNNLKGLIETCESVSNQTCHDYEHIVIDGGSTDGSSEWIQAHVPQFTYWVSEHDKGCYHAMNKGIKVAKGEYIIFMNSGDYFYSPTILEEVKKLKPTEDVLCGNIFLSIGHVKFAPESPTFRYLYEGGLSHQACFIKTEVQKEHPYDESMRIASDWDFFLEVLIIDNGTYRKIDLIIAWFDFNGISSCNKSLEKIERETILRRRFPERIIKDYELNATLEFRKLFFWIEKTNFHKPIYFINVFIIKLISFFTGAKWIKEFGFRERQTKRPINYKEEK